MKLHFLLILSLVFLASAEQAEFNVVEGVKEMIDDDQLSFTSRGIKFKVKEQRVTNQIDCPKIFQIRIIVTYTITVLGFKCVVQVRRKCFPPKKARRIAKKDRKCIRRLVQRNCNPNAPDNRLKGCVLAQIRACAPFANLKQQFP